MCKTRLSLKIHPRTSPRMQSSSSAWKSSSTQPSLQESGIPEDAGTAPPEGTQTGETQGDAHRRRRGIKDAGIPGDLPVGAAGRFRRRGNPETGSGGEAGAVGRQGNLERHWQRRQRMRDSSQLENPSPAAGRCRARGYPGAASGGEAGAVGRQGNLERHWQQR